MPPAVAHGGALGRDLPVWSVGPFVLMLLGIAVIPLVWPHFWERNRNKGLLSLVLGAPVVLWTAAHAPDVVAHTALEYVSFISLIGSLYVASGGILIRVRRRGTPVVNAILLLFGSFLANVFGTDAMPYAAVWYKDNSAAPPVVFKEDFTSFKALAVHEGNSRVWGGIHFRFELDASHKVCADVADYIYDHKMQPDPFRHW